jgi:hypothetical protein
VTDHLIDRGNIRDVAFALFFATLLALLVWTVSGCTPQQMGNTMPLMSMGTSMTSQAANLYFQQQQQAQLQKQQELQFEQLRANQR